MTSPNPRKTDNFVRLNPLKVKIAVALASHTEKEPPKVFHDYFGSEQGSIDGQRVIPPGESKPLKSFELKMLSLKFIYFLRRTLKFRRNLQILVKIT